MYTKYSKKEHLQVRISSRNTFLMVYIFLEKGYSNFQLNVISFQIIENNGNTQTLSSVSFNFYNSGLNININCKMQKYL